MPLFLQESKKVTIQQNRSDNSSVVCNTSTYKNEHSRHILDQHNKHYTTCMLDNRDKVCWACFLALSFFKREYFHHDY